MKLPAYILIAFLIATATWAIDSAASGHLDAGVSLTEGIVYPVNAEHSPAGGSEQAAANAPPRPILLPKRIEVIRMRVTAYCPGACCCGEFADGITANHPEAHLLVALIGERPEEVTDMRRSIKGEVFSSTFDEPVEDHIKGAAK